MTIAGLNIIDATLREGAQTPGVNFDAASSRRVARALNGLGVDMIECGHAAIGAEERDRIRSVVSVAASPVLSHARADLDDVRAAAATGAAWVGVFIGVNERSRNARLSRRVARAVPDYITRSVAEAKALDLNVRFTVEDASRTEDGELLDAFALAIDAGADRICYADTVGRAAPDEVARITRAIRAAAPQTPLELHLHNDRGLALANALAGAEAGADWVATTVNGIGERCGVVDTLQLLVNMRLEAPGTRAFPSGAAIALASSTVSLAAGAPVPTQHACTGAHAFTHTSRLHVQAMARDRTSCEAFDPRLVGRRRKLAAQAADDADSAAANI